ncbi:MAG: hypothetical protein AAGC79_00185 [Pseudomonadota bacterium]
MQVAGLVVFERQEREFISDFARRLAAYVADRYGATIACQIAGKSLLFSTDNCVTGETARGRFALSGYNTAPDRSELCGFVERAQSCTEPSFEVTNSIGGLFSIFALTAEGGVALRSKPACSGVYYGQTPGMLVACNRPGLAAAILESEIDPSYLDWLIATGFPLDDTTPFCGVRAVLGHQALRVRHDRLELIGYTLTGQGARCQGESETQSRHEDFEQEMLRACGAVSQFNEVELRLSGGKDSRLIAAAIAHQGLSVPCRTRGQSEDADLAEQVAQIAGFPIQREVVQHRATNPEDFQQQSLDALGWSDGLIEFETHVAYEKPIGHSPSTDGILFGHSHLQKGAFAKNMQGTSPDRAQEILRDSYIPKDIRTEHRARFLAPIAHHFDPKLYEAPIDMLFEPYAIYRIGRYIEPLYLKLSRFMVPLFPLDDERFFLACSRMNRHHRTREIACHAALQSFAPEMLAIPFFQDKWRFEPLSAMPKPLPPSGGKPNFRQIPVEFIQFARAALRGTNILERSIDLLEDNFLATCGLHPKMSSNERPTHARLARKTVLRLYLLHLLETEFDVGRLPASAPAQSAA